MHRRLAAVPGATPRTRSPNAEIVKLESTPLRSPVEVRAARFDLVSRLADDLAHEIRNPLHAMVINLEVMRRRVAKGAAREALERADVLAHELQRVNRLVDQLLTVLRPDRAGVRVLDLDDVLRDVMPLVELRARAERKHLDFVPAGDDASVLATADAINIAVLAATDWALATTPADGGRVVVRCDRPDAAASFHIVVEAHGTHDGGAASNHAEDPLETALVVARGALAEVGGTADATTAPAGGYRSLVLTIPSPARA